MLPLTVAYARGHTALFAGFLARRNACKLTHCTYICMPWLTGFRAWHAGPGDALGGRINDAVAERERVGAPDRGAALRPGQQGALPAGQPAARLPGGETHKRVGCMATGKSEECTRSELVMHASCSVMHCFLDQELPHQQLQVELPSGRLCD